jgi:adenine-specific DNA methylase
MKDKKRLIEVAFPLKQASIDSVHEKNVRHGHISTLHIWPARRPLAACRAALVATLLPDPGDEKERKKLLKKLGGEVVEEVREKRMPNGRIEEHVVEQTEGGILHWGRESSPELEWFRKKIREAYGGRAPKVLDPFAGGGAIPLEAMRLGCEVTAADINPVAWFILKCTLEYPQRLAGQYLPLPDFALESSEFMESYLKGTGKLTKKQLERKLEYVQMRLFPSLDTDLSWHVRAWGWWVLQRARKELAYYYPTYAEKEPLKPYSKKPGEETELRLVPLKDDGTPDIASLNSKFDAGHLAAPAKPRWVAKPTLAYLWARTVKCKGCRATIPLLKTLWLCKKPKKRVLLTMTPNSDASGVVFGIEQDIPVEGRNAAQRREHDRRLGQGTISRSGAWCPCCGKHGTVSMKTEDIRQAGMSAGMGILMTAVVVDGQKSKEYRLPTELEHDRAEDAANRIGAVFSDIPFGVPDEPLPKKEALGIRVARYGIDRWSKLFLPRQLIALGIFVGHIRSINDPLIECGYPNEWVECISAFLALALDRVADRSSMQCRPDPTPTQSGVINTFSRFALPITWDSIESVTTSDSSGGFSGALEWVAKVVEHCSSISVPEIPSIEARSALEKLDRKVDVILTDPPYYDAIPYSDLMDFFYVWLRRTLHGLSSAFDDVLATPLGPKWDRNRCDGELIDDSSRFDGNRKQSKEAYETGMFRAFEACNAILNPDGRIVVVFANKNPNAWETLVAAMIRAGFVVSASWPIQTEMGTRTRAISSAALSSSVWLVCKKRSVSAKPGWDNIVLQQMREQIASRLSDFWDAGIRGPDFVWAATGPALEVYSQHPAVKKTNDPGQTLSVPEFLRSARRMVVEYIVGRVLAQDVAGDSVAQLDDVTTYYLLHRHDFGLEQAPAGACILYAISCGLSDRELEVQLDLISRGGRATASADDEAESNGDVSEGSGGSTFRLKPWDRRTRSNLGLESAGGRQVPMIDQVHRLMRLWKAGEVSDVDRYVTKRGLGSNLLFPQVVQALIELAGVGSAERSVLESIANHLKGIGINFDRAQPRGDWM